MRKNARTRKEWVVVRTPSKKQKGEKKEESDFVTHRRARSLAIVWYADGFKVELQRRREGEKAHSITPRFPGVDRKRRVA